MTAEQICRNIRYVVIRDDKIIVAAFETNGDAARYADWKSYTDGRAYLVDLKSATMKERFSDYERFAKGD